MNKQGKKRYWVLVGALALAGGLYIAADSVAQGRWGGCGGGGYGPGGGYGMMRGGCGHGPGMMRGGGMHGLAYNLPLIKERLALRPDQEAAWKAVEKAVTDHLAARDAARTAMRETVTTDFTARAEARLAVMESMLADKKIALEAWKGLESVLDDTQKTTLKTFTAMGGGRGGWGGRGGRGRCQGSF